MKFEKEKSTVNVENPQTSVFRQEHLEDRRLPLTPLDLEQGKEKEKMGTDEDKVWRQGNEVELLDGKPCPPYLMMGVVIEEKWARPTSHTG